MRMLSTSSTIAYWCMPIGLPSSPTRPPCWTFSSSVRGHVVAQVVEAELGVGAVRDVGRVGGALVLVGLHVLQHAPREPEAVVDRAHPLRVAAGEVVVDRDDVHALAGERVEHHGERARERLALAGAHLGDRAAVEHHAADQLDVEVAHLHAPARRPRARRAKVSSSRSSSDSPSRARSRRRSALRAQLLVVQQLELRLPRVDRRRRASRSA